MINILLLYLVIILVATWFVTKRSSKTNFISHYFIGNRALSGFLLAMTTVATYIGASSFIGGPGAAHRFGFGWIFIAMIQVPALLFVFGVIGKKMSYLADKYNAVTINDILQQKYQSKTVVLLSSIAIIIGFSAMIIVQLIGAGKLLETTLNIDYKTAVIIFALIVSIYTFIGGFRAVVVTDSIQGIIMVIGTILLLSAVIIQGGGIEAIVTKLEQIDPKLLANATENHSFHFIISFWFLVCLALIAVPALLVRAMSYKNTKALHTAIIVGTIVLTLLMFGMHLVGVLGRAIVDDVKSPDHIIPTLMITVLPPAVAGVFLIAPIAAIMSSIDSQLIQISATIVKDLCLSYKPQTGTKTVKTITLTCNIALIIILTSSALTPPDMLIWLNLFSLGMLEATFLWVFVFLLFWQKATASGAIASMISGFSSYLIFNIFSIKIFDLHSVVPSIFISLLAFLIFNGKFDTQRKLQHNNR